MIYFSLNKNSKKAMYLQISDQIRNMILSGELKYNQKLFSEKEFTHIYNVSDVVVKQAYGVLRKEGLVRSVKGLGTFVTNREIVTLSFNDLFYVAGFENDSSFKTIILINELLENVEKQTISLKVLETENVYRLNLIVLKKDLPYIYRTFFYKEKYHKVVNKYFNEQDNIIKYFSNHKKIKLNTELIYHTKIADSIISSILLVDEKDPIASYKLILSNDEEEFMHVETNIPGNYLLIRKVD